MEGKETKSFSVQNAPACPWEGRRTKQSLLINERRDVGLG